MTMVLDVGLGSHFIQFVSKEHSPNPKSGIISIHRWAEQLFAGDKKIMEEFAKDLTSWERPMSGQLVAVYQFDHDTMVNAPFWHLLETISDSFQTDWLVVSSVIYLCLTFSSSLYNQGLPAYCNRHYTL